MKRLNILVYGDQDLNIMDGSAIWLTSLINMLTLDKKVDVTLLLKAPIRRNHVMSNIKDFNYIKIINPVKMFGETELENGKRLSVKEAAEVIEQLNNKNQYDLIITRGMLLTKESLKKNYREKQIPYITDFTHDELKMDDEEKKLFLQIYETFPGIFVQTNEMKTFLERILGVDGKKFILLNPAVNDIEKEPSFGNKNFSIIYTGKFAKQWKTEEMIEVFKKVHEKRRYITLNVAGDKFQGELIDKKEEIVEKLIKTDGVNWVGAVSHDESMELIKRSDIGFAYRSEEVDNNNSLELSTKFLEYGINGKPVIVRRTLQYERLLGKDYPLFANDEKELYAKILLAFDNEEIYHQAAVKCFNASKEHQLSQISNKVLQRLWKFKEGKQTILFAGHDFKFLNWYIEKCKEDDNLNVLIDKWDGHENHDIDRSEQLLDEADVIFCEWGLGNAVWYSNNKRRGQKLIVRLHRQEIDTKFLSLINYDNVDKIIVIAPHLFEEFNRLRNVPRSKMVIIDNMIDCERFDKPKHNDIDFNLGIIGILPKLKRLDRALDIFEKLWVENNRYKLFIKSKLPHELPWLMGRTAEKEYYEQVFQRIESAPWKDNVIFDPHGNDVDEWLRKIKFILSTSDIEGSHVSPMEGMASGSIPIIYHWPGAETVYPSRFIVENVQEAVEKIKDKNIADGFDFKEYTKRYDYNSRVKLFDELLFN